MSRGLITFCGDLFLPDKFDAHVSGAENVVINFESPITRYRYGYPGKINLKVEENHLTSTFKDCSVIACLANNHILDFQRQGFEDTVRSLESSGIKYFGAGYEEDDCNNPLVIRCGDQKVSLMGYVCETASPIYCAPEHPGVRPIDVAVISRDIDASRRMGATRAVVCLHWGAEQVYLPKPIDVEIAHSLIDAGADLIIGHHAHRIQHWEEYRGRKIFYGLGNYIFPDVSVESYFRNGEAHGSQWIKARMNWLNRRSISVTYDPMTNDCEVAALQFDGRRVRRVRLSKHQGGKAIQLDKRYMRQFRRSYVRGKVFHALTNFVHSPKVPSIRHVRALIALCTSGHYK